ncbi:MAG TPA: TIR domain-containing protein, partial [Pseudonocardiaceae bacterium]|nr:TIR domain-containing protein [Pseudonocardiaceae bacterium]
MYEYDVFISYKRAGANVPAWIRTHFYPRLSELLDDNHDREVKIFFDDTIPGGTAWPLELRAALGRTRILLPVCSPKYFLDEWCLAEWHSMARREELVGMMSPERPQGLIYPVIFCDSETFPNYAKQRRMRSFRSWNQPYPQFQVTVEYLNFHREMERIAEELIKIIDQAPEWRPDWPVA